MLKFISDFMKPVARLFGRRTSETKYGKKELFAENAYLTRTEKPKVIFGIGMKGTVVGYDGKLVKDNAVSLKTLVQRYDNIKIMTCTVGPYPRDKKEQEKLHKAFISCGVSEACFLASNKRVTVTPNGLQEEDLPQEVRTKPEAYLDMIERHGMAKRDLIMMNGDLSILLKAFDMNKDFTVVPNIVSAYAEIQSRLKDDKDLTP